MKAGPIYFLIVPGRHSGMPGCHIGVILAPISERAIALAGYVVPGRVEDGAWMF